MRPRVSASAAVLQRRQAALRGSSSSALANSTNSHGHGHGHPHPHAPPPNLHKGNKNDLDDSSSHFGSSSSSSLPPTALLYSRYFPPPDLPSDGAFVFELIIFCYSMVAMVLQLLHLYRSVFWLPHSYNTNAVNWYLIEWHLLSFAGVFLGRRLAWSALKALISVLTPTRWAPSFVIVARALITMSVPAALFFLIYFKMGQYPMINLLYLAYPVLVYFCLFGFAAEPFLELTPGNPSTEKNKIYKDKTGKFQRMSTSPFSFSSPFSSSKDPLPEDVRTESESMRKDFNARMRQVAFNSICGAYYTTFVPCAFTQSYLHFERSWVGRHVMLTWVGCFSLYAVQCFPGAYVHAMHKCASFLGKWTRIEGRVSPNFYNAWSPQSFWPRGSIVRHGRDLFRAEGVANAAEPDDLGQARFYALFRDVSLFSWLGLIFQSGLVLAQHVSLSWSSHWYMLLSEAILLFANYYALFKVTRDYLVFMRLHVAEQDFAKDMEEKN